MKQLLLSLISLFFISNVSLFHRNSLSFSNVSLAQTTEKEYKIPCLDLNSFKSFVSQEKFQVIVANDFDNVKVSVSFWANGNKIFFVALYDKNDSSRVCIPVYIENAKVQ